MIATAARDRRCPDPAPVSVRRSPGLSRDEERELAEAVAAGDRAARDRLIRANLGLVVTIARRLLGRGLDLDDLVGEGNLGLIRAAEEFDPCVGTRFSTYAVYWIKQAIRDALIRTTAAIRVPDRVVGLLTKWRRAERALGGELGRPPRFDEIASCLGLSETRKLLVARALDAGRFLPTGGRGVGADYRLSDEVADQQGPAEERVEAEDERAVAWRLIRRLGTRERAILMLRYGLEGEILTLEQIGRRLGVTRERVRKLEARALRKLGEVAKAKR